VPVRPEAPPSELAVAVARHFEQMDVDEEECIGGLLERLEAGPSASTEYARRTQHYPSGNVGMVNSNGTVAGGVDSSGNGQIPVSGKKVLGKGKKIPKKGKDGKPIPAPSAASTTPTTTPTTPANTIQTHPHRRRTKWAARPGEQVAAKVTRTDENGSWILASVQRFYPDTETYDVQDEDDTSKLIRLPWSHVMRLSTGSEGCFNKGSPKCMAIFPETTSFYKATVAKAPVWRLDHGVPTVREMIVKFDDDEDGSSGKTPHRRVPSRYVIPVPSAYFYDEQDDVDLVPPNSVGTAAGGVGAINGTGGGGGGLGGNDITGRGGSPTHGAPPSSLAPVPHHPLLGPMTTTSTGRHSPTPTSSASSPAVAVTATAGGR
jgi:SGF29 tudor-like domain